MNCSRPCKVGLRNAMMGLYSWVVAKKITTMESTTNITISRSQIISWCKIKWNLRKMINTKMMTVMMTAQWNSLTLKIFSSSTQITTRQVVESTRKHWVLSMMMIITWRGVSSKMENSSWRSSQTATWWNPLPRWPCAGRAVSPPLLWLFNKTSRLNRVGRTFP